METVDAERSLADRSLTAVGSAEFNCIGCGEPIGPGRARVGAVTCHDCNGALGVPGLDAPADSAISPAQESMGAMETELRTELYRSRRYGRTLTLISGPDDDEGSVGKAVVLHLRATDRVWTGNGRFVLLLPEADRADGEALVGRLAAEELSLVERGTVAMAAFPEDGLTAGALLAAVGPIRGLGAATTDELSVDRTLTGRVMVAVRLRKNGHVEASAAG